MPQLTKPMQIQADRYSASFKFSDLAIQFLDLTDENRISWDGEAYQQDYQIYIGGIPSVAHKARSVIWARWPELLFPKDATYLYVKGKEAGLKIIDILVKEFGLTETERNAMRAVVGQWRVRTSFSPYPYPVQQTVTAGVAATQNPTATAPKTIAQLAAAELGKILNPSGSAAAPATEPVVAAKLN